MSVFTMMDLCAGIGGIRHGFEMTGHFHNVLSAEIEPNACAAYKHLYGEDPTNDLTSEAFKKKTKNLDCDVLAAGFPCQTFSRAGKKAGFKDEEKGIIFFAIRDIIKGMKRRPKCLVLENVDNLLTHDKGNTFKTILKTLIQELGYHVVGAALDPKTGEPIFNSKDFIRNSKNFGVPQNRPRVYMIAFDKRRYKSKIKNLPTSTPSENKHIHLYKSLNDLLDKEVEPKYFLSSGYLKTLEKHAEREKKKGHGFGYRIVNTPDISNPIANTILATGGSGKERNLVLDVQNGKKYAGQEAMLKKSPINNKNIRMMTPNEWGKLQGFVNYGFKKGRKDMFSFPENLTDSAKYKLFGNAVTIPVARTMADFVLVCFGLLGE
ncbi:MAG: DNA (cytosine-5-)-methyltransferase [Alphaproteobacteria bacterium]|nr:DNA (cytosine-5-)-methyltransferase [Alphaproteobacteria bacterium]